MEKYSLCYSITNHKKAVDELLEYKMHFIARNLIVLLPITVIGMLFAFSNVESGKIFSSLRGIITFVYFAGLIIGLVIFPWVKLVLEAKKCSQTPKEVLDVKIIFGEDYMAIYCKNDIRRMYYCDIVRILHKNKLKYLAITSSLNSDLKPFYRTHPLGGYQINIPFSELKEETLKDVENYLRAKGKEIKYA